MFCNLFPSISTRKSAAPTTMQSQPRPAAPLEHPSKLRGAIRTVFQVLHLRRSKPKNDEPIEDSQVPQTPAVPYQNPSTRIQNPKIVSTSAVPLTTAKPSTTPNLAALATISPLFAPQHPESTTTPATTFPSSPITTDLISTKEMIANLASAVSGLKYPVQERDRRWVMEDAAEEVLHHREKAKKKKEALKKKILDSESRSNFSEDKGCHPSGCDERGLGPKAPDSSVLFKDGRIRANTGGPNAGKYPYSSYPDEGGRRPSNGSPVWYKSGGTRGRTGSPSPTPAPSRRLRPGEMMSPRGPRGIRY